MTGAISNMTNCPQKTVAINVQRCDVTVHLVDGSKVVAVRHGFRSWLKPHDSAYRWPQTDVLVEDPDDQLLKALACFKIITFSADPGFEEGPCTAIAPEKILKVEIGPVEPHWIELKLPKRGLVGVQCDGNFMPLAHRIKILSEEPDQEFSEELW